MNSNNSKNYTLFSLVIVVAVVGIIYLFQQFTNTPENFPVGKSFTIQENETLQSVSHRLEDGGYITSSLLFRVGVSFLGKDREIKLGGYVFEESMPLFQIISVFAEGKPSAPLLSVTIPEGSTTKEVAILVTKALPAISVELFNTTVERYDANGKLFPSTYFLLPSYGAQDIVEMMLSTFSKKATEQLSASFPNPLKSEHDVLVLASILEGEAKGAQDMAIVSGILLNRLRANMPLQVDVAMETYKQKGLPEKPINNPGLVAINAVLHPTFTDYFYYITGNDGKMYYAKTFDIHKKNIQKYLK